MKLSVVIPVYNTGKYLSRCLDSLLDGIPAGEVEIIVVNDGSTDNSLQIAGSYGRRYECVRVFSQPNAGQSVARNAGMAEAAGEYLWFVDSDDYVAPGSVGAIIDACSKYSPDLLAIGSARVSEDKYLEDAYYSPSLEGQTMSGPGMMRRGLLKSVCPPFLVARRSFLTDNGLCFLPGVFHEDDELIPRMVYEASTVAFLPQVCYLVYSRPGSTTRHVNPKRSRDQIAIAARLDGYSSRVPAEDRYLFSRHITDLLNAAMKLTRDYDRGQRAEVGALLYENRRLLGHMTRCRIPKFVLEGCLLRLFPKRALGIYHFLQGAASKMGLSTERKI